MPGSAGWLYQDGQPIIMLWVCGVGVGGVGGGGGDSVVLFSLVVMMVLLVDVGRFTCQE